MLSKKVLLWIAWPVVFLMISGPPVPTLEFFLGDIRLYDFLFLLLCFVFCIVLVGRPRIHKFRPHASVLAVIFYVVTVLVLPLMGIMLYGAPLDWYLGDLRWIEVIALAFVFWLIYGGFQGMDFEKHLYYFIWILVLFQAVFVGAQLLYQVFDFAPFWFFEFYYPEYEYSYGEYGVHINRYAGAMRFVSGLALVSGIGFLFSGIRLFQEKKWSDLLLLIISFGLMLSTGSRTIILSAPVILVLIVIIVVALHGTLNTKLLKRFFVLIGALFLLSIGVVSLNVGRFASFERYAVVFNWIAGGVTFEQISGRGHQIWAEPIAEAYNNFSFMGTLVNPSHAVDLIDSYYLFALVQAGPFILSFFLITILGLVWSGFKGIVNKKKNSTCLSFMLSTGSVLGVLATTQNLMTGMPGRVFLTMAVFTLCALKYTKAR